jgi:hypothetical protein
VSVLLSDVLDIPLAAGDDDYVLRLTDGIAFHLLAAESMEEALFSGYVRRQAEFVDLDTGLTVIAEHAKSLRHIAAHASVPAAKGER